MLSATRKINCGYLPHAAAFCPKMPFAMQEKLAIGPQQLWLTETRKPRLPVAIRMKAQVSVA
jgi:hypothetical protein